MMKRNTRNCFFRGCLVFALIFGGLNASSSTHAAENPLGDLWPFKNKISLESFTVPTAPPKDKASGSLWDGPARLWNKAEKQTSQFMNKTKVGLQDFGRGLNPFGKPKPKVAKKSWLDRFLPKQSEPAAPATVGEFLNMKRPGF